MLMLNEICPFNQHVFCKPGKAKGPLVILVRRGFAAKGRLISDQFALLCTQLLGSIHDVGLIQLRLLFITSSVHKAYG